MVFHMGDTEVRGRMAASGVGSTDHPLYVCDKLSFSILRSELSVTTPFTPDASWSGNKARVTLTAAAAARGDHHTFNSWVALTCLWPHTHTTRIYNHICIQTCTPPLSKTHTHSTRTHNLKLFYPSFIPLHTSDAHRPSWGRQIRLVLGTAG